MKTLLFGASGYLGSYLAGQLPTIKVASGCFPVDDGIQLVINCVSKTNVEACECHPIRSLYSNVKFAAELVRRYPQARIIQFSSYYVYDGIGLNDEQGPVTQKFAYARHKLLAEEVVRGAGGVIFRLGKLFGHPERLLENRLTEWVLRTPNPAELTIDDARFNPTSVQQVARVISAMMEGLTLRGIFNLSNLGSCSHAEYVNEILSNLDRAKSFQRIQKMARTFPNYGRFEMDTRKIERVFMLTPWRKDLETFLDTLRASKPSVLDSDTP